MHTLSNKEAALLGLLSEEAMHPYDIEKEITNRNLMEWTDISMSSVYKILMRLEEKGLVNCMVRISENNRIQKIYSVTIAGHNSMTEWVREQISHWEKTTWPIDIAISNLFLLSNTEIVSCLRNYIRSIDGHIGAYNKKLEQLGESGRFHEISLIRRPLRLLEAEKQWAEEVLVHYQTGMGV